MNSIDVKSFLCPITNSLMEEPVIAMDGHSYERKAFEGWLKRGHNVSPKTLQPLPSTAYIPNLALKEAIDAFKARHPEDLSLEIALARKELELQGASTPSNQSLSRTSSGNSAHFPERSPGTQQAIHYDFPTSPGYPHYSSSSSSAYQPPLPPINERPRRGTRGSGPGPNGMTVEQVAKAIQHGDQDERLTHFMNWAQMSGNTVPPPSIDRFGRPHDLHPRASRVSLSSKPRVWNSITRKDSWALGPEPDSMRKSSFRNESNMQLKQTRSADALAEELRKSFVASEASDLSDDEDLMGKVMREARSSLAAARLAELDLDYIPPPPPDTPPPLDPPPPPRNQLSTTHAVSVKKLSQTGVANKQGFLNQSVAAAVMTRGSESAPGGAPANDDTPPPPPPDSPPANAAAAAAKPAHHSSLSGVFGQPKPPDKKPVPLPSQLPRPSSHSVISPPPPALSPTSGDGAAGTPVSTGSSSDILRESRTARTQSESLLSPRSDSISLVKGAGGRVVREKVFSNGDKYVGEWERDKMNGQGRYVFAKDGSSYEGEFLDGRMNGYGIYIDKDGGRFEGYYQQGRKHGMGTYVYHNGATYEGEWAYDKKHGKGKLTFPNGDVYTGDFVDNKFCGRGVFRSAKGDVYEGEYSNSKKNGRGTQTFAAGGSYTGDWLDNKKHGQGVCIYANGARYEGGWVDNLRQGFGVYTFATGPRYEGEWLADKMHGHGILYKPNGTKEEGEYRHNRLLVPGESGTTSS